MSTPETTPAPDPLAPTRLGPITLRNATIKAATYEGLSHRGHVTRDLVDFHVGYAKGGVGMTTVAYCAVAKEGRTDRHQIYWRDEAMPGLRVLTDAVHAEGAAISAQIGHGGPVAEPKGNGAPALAPSRFFNKAAMGLAQEIDLAGIERVKQQHADAAVRAIEAGFDAIEVHLGHNYLISSFLSPRINHRTDSYGGSLENRARLARETMRVLRQNQRWALVYNLVVVPFGALGFVPPWLAALGMSASSLVVVLNATRIGRRVAPSLATTPREALA